jgi:hypothetical protein
MDINNHCQPIINKKNLNVAKSNPAQQTREKFCLSGALHFWIISLRVLFIITLNFALLSTQLRRLRGVVEF